MCGAPEAVVALIRGDCRLADWSEDQIGQANECDHRERYTGRQYGPSKWDEDGKQDRRTHDNCSDRAAPGSSEVSRLRETSRTIKVWVPHPLKHPNTVDKAKTAAYAP